MKKTKLFLLAILSSSLLASCGALPSETTTSETTGSETTNTETTNTQTSVEELPTVEITQGETYTVYETQNVFLTATFTPSTAIVTWTSSNAEIASIDATGSLTGLKPGTATIRASVTEEIYDEITVTVAPTIIDTSTCGSFDYEGLFSETPSIKTIASLENGVNSYAAFKGTAGKYYIASANIKIASTSSDDTWSRTGISHLNLESKSYYGFQISPGVNFTQPKSVTMVIDQNGGVQWGTLTDRSQVWNGHGINNVDWTNVKLTTVRADNVFFSFVNNELFYVDQRVGGFSDVDTIPCLNVGSAQAEFSNISVAYGEESVFDFLATVDLKALYPMDPANTEVKVENEKLKVSFTGSAEQLTPTNAKDHAAKSIGDALSIEGDGHLLFDLKINAFGSRDALPALAVTINRYDEQYAEARSMVIGQYKAGWTGWNSNGNLNDGIGDGGKAYLEGEARLEEGQIYHCDFHRIMTDGGQDTELTIKNSEGTVLVSYTHGWNDGYKGRASFSFLDRDLDCEITNIGIVS